MRLAMIMLSLSINGNLAPPPSISPPDVDRSARTPDAAFVRGVEAESAPLAVEQLETNLADAPQLTPWPGPVWQYEVTINEAAEYYHLPPPVVAAIVWRESAGRRESVSRVGAIGLMGILPGYHRCASFNPTANIWCGSGILSRFRNNAEGDLRAALAAYNAGETGRDDRGLGWDYAKLILGIAENFGYFE